MSSVSELRFTREHQARSTGSGRGACGYAYRLDTVADIGGEYLERILPGAGARAIREKQDCKFLINHNPSLILARVGNGSLELKEDMAGLWFRATVVETTAGNDFLSLTRSGLINECSFSFMAVKERWSKTKDATGKMRDLRELQDINLFDVSAVVFPAYSGTSVSAESSLAASAGAGRMSVMFPSGPPMSLPVELRNRIQLATQISQEERAFRERVRAQANRLLSEDDSFVEYARKRNADILKSL